MGYWLELELEGSRYMFMWPKRWEAGRGDKRLFSCLVVIMRKESKSNKNRIQVGK